MRLTSLGSVWLKGPGSQGTVAVRCHRRGASSWLCLPDQRRQLWFCVTSCGAHGDPGALDLDPSCRDFLGVRPAGTQRWHQTPGTGTELLSDPTEAQLAAVATQEGSDTCSPQLPGGSANSGRDSRQRMEPPQPRAGIAQRCMGLPGWFDVAGVWGWRGTGRVGVTGASSTCGGGGSERGATWPGSMEASPEARTRWSPGKGLRENPGSAPGVAAVAGRVGRGARARLWLLQQMGPREEDRWGER